MKIAYLGNFEDPGFEGLRTIVEALKKSASKKHKIQVNDTRDASVYHCHSNGFALAVKKYDKPVIYSLHTNIVSNPLKILWEQVQLWTHLFSFKNTHKGFFKQLKSSIMRVVSQCVPLFVKKHYLKKMNVLVVPNKWLDRKLGLPNTHVIYHGIDLKRFVPLNKSSGGKSTAS